jgi:hypothetical protein
MTQKWWHKLGRFVLGGLVHLLIIAILTAVFWWKLRHLVYDGQAAGSSDFFQYVHYVVYETRHMGFPLSAWNHLWHKGAPRILDTSWMHFYLIQLLIAAVGVLKAIWLYPVITLWLLVVFSYGLFYEASRSRLLALGLAVVLIMSQSIHLAYTGVGMASSTFSQMFLPAQLYFLVRFYNRGNCKNLVLGALMGVFGLFSHGLTMSFFGLVPAGLFILFSLKGHERFVSKRTIKNAFLYLTVVLSVGALAFWPGFLVNTFTGGGQAAMGFSGGNKAEADPEVFKDLVEATHSGLWWALGIGLIVWLVSWWWRRKKQNQDERVTPYFVVAGFIFLWFLSYFLGINRYIALFITWRIFWTVPVVGGLLAARWLRPLSEGLQLKNFWWRLGWWLGAGGVKLIILLLITQGVLGAVGAINIDQWRGEYQTWKPIALDHEMTGYFAGPLSLVNKDDWNHRLWTADWNFNQRWALVSDMPLSEGYFHFATKRSDLWEGWASTLLSGEMQKKGDINWEAGIEQVKFFLDWYGINSLWACSQNQSFCYIWDYFKQDDNPLVEKKLVVKNPPGMVFTIKNEFTSGVVEPSQSPVIGFIGSDNGYRGFMLNLATLNLNSTRVVGLRLGGSIRVLTDEILKDLDGVVVYDQRKQGWFDAGAWERLRRYAEQGGRVWLETGGNSVMRNKGNLPSLFPVKAVEYGDLGRTWQLEGDWAGEIGITQLAPLVFGNDIWKISYSQDNLVKPGAQVVLRQAGYPVGVEMDLGKGKVLWTGMNWFFRQEAYKENGLKEAQPVRLMLNKLFGEFDHPVIKAEIDWVKPEEVKVMGEGLRGVINKTNHWPGWTATAEAGGMNKKLRIYTAGPELMYVSIPQDWQDKPVTVSFQYRGAPLDWICLGITVGSSLVVIYYLITGHWFMENWLKARLKLKIKIGTEKKTIKSWWEDEES